MYNLNLGSVNHDADFVKVSRSRSSRTQVRLNRLRSDVVAAYERYEQAARTESLKSVSPLLIPSSDDAKALYSNFQRLDTGNPCQDIREDLLSLVQDGMCPYCRLHDATTLDHILERAQYPEYAVFRLNLAPVCSLCNTTKENTRGMLRGREPFHLYLQGFPSASFLDVSFEILPAKVGIDFALKRPEFMSEVAFDALERHFLAVKLGQRYKRRGRSELRDRVHDMARLHARGGPASVSAFLRRDAISRARNWSDHDWLPTLLRAAAASDQFCDQGYLGL